MLDSNESEDNKDSGSDDWKWFRNRIMLAFPMMCDSCATVFLFLGYLNLQASIAQMMGSLVVFVTCVESVLILKKKLYRHHWLGAIIVVIGI